jgi:hypothetical protein
MILLHCDCEISYVKKIEKNMTKQKLPQSVIDDLDSNIMFNKFGLVNIGRLKSSTNCDIEDDVLKELIQEHFGKEMATGKVEFVGEK